MADTKLSALVALTGSALAADDLYYVADTSATASKSIRSDELFAAAARVGASSQAVVENTLVVRKPGGVAGTDEGSVFYDTSLHVRGPTNGAVGIGWNGATEGIVVAPASSQVVVGYNLNVGADALLGNQVLIRFSNPSFSYDAALQHVNSVGPVIRVTNAAGGAGWIQNWAGDAPYVSTNVTNATATMAAVTGMTTDVITGRKYGFVATVKCNNSTAAEGIAFDFVASTATMISFAASASLLTGGTTVATNAVSSALATALTFTTVTGETWIEIRGAFEVNASGTFAMRFAEGAAHISGTATVSANTTMRLWDIP